MTYGDNMEFLSEYSQYLGIMIMITVGFLGAVIKIYPIFKIQWKLGKNIYDANVIIISKSDAIQRDIENTSIIPDKKISTIKDARDAPHFSQYNICIYEWISEDQWMEDYDRYDFKKNLPLIIHAKPGQIHPTTMNSINNDFLYVFINNARGRIVSDVFSSLMFSSLKN